MTKEIKVISRHGEDLGVISIDEKNLRGAGIVFPYRNNIVGRFNIYDPYHSNIKCIELRIIRINGEACLKPRIKKGYMKALRCLKQFKETIF